MRAFTRAGLVTAVAAGLVVGAAGIGAVAQASTEKPSSALLQKARSVEAFLTGKYKFNEPMPDGKVIVSFEDFAHFGVGNISTERGPEKKAPAWSGRQFAVEASQKDNYGSSVAVSLKGTMSADFSKIETMAVQKTVREANGTVTTARWTFKNLAGKVVQNPYTRAKSVSYGDIYPLDQAPVHLSEASFSRGKAGQKETTFAGIPTLAEIEAQYKGNAYLDSHKRVQFSVVFVLN